MAELLERVGDLAPVRVIAAITLGTLIVLFLRRVAQPGAGVLLRRTLRDGTDAEGSPEEQLRRRVATLTGFVIGSLITVTAAAVILFALAEAGIRVDALLAGAGIVGISIGFGSQTIVRDALSGMFLLIENPYNLGDYVRLNALEGEVVGISLRRTTLMGDDGTVHTIPNGAITATSNFTHRAARHAVTLRVASDVPLERVRAAVQDVALAFQQAPEVADEIVDGPTVRGVTGFRGDSYDVEIRTLLARRARRNFPFLLNRQLADAFERHEVRVL